MMVPATIALAARLRDRAATRGQQTLERRFEARHTQARERSDRIRALIEGRTEPAGRRRSGDESDDDARLESVPQSA
jgi:hypothetical protein